jgi:hypothetical protein
MPQRHKINSGAELHVRGAGSDGGERGQGFKARAREDAVADPDRVKAHALGLDSQFDHALNIGATVWSTHYGIPRRDKESKTCFGCLIFCHTNSNECLRLTRLSARPLARGLVF